MLAGLVELNVRITFLRQAQVYHAVSDVSEVIAAIKRQLAFVLTLELFEFLRVRTFYPAGSGNVNGFVDSFNVIFAFQTRYHHSKLPPTDSGILGPVVTPDNLTVTVSVGESLFDERYGLSSVKPKHLSRMQGFPNDALEPAFCHGDLSLQFCANTADTNIHALPERMLRGLYCAFLLLCAGLLAIKA